MINNVEDFLKTYSKFFVISKGLAEQLYKSTRNAKLKVAMKRSPVLITKELHEVLKNKVIMGKESISKARAARKTGGGRPRLPIPENSENLSREEKLRLYNRIKQRESRYNRGITKTA